ncbi:MAG: ABC transporter ATP-binding protein [Dehalococcoidia bacterium]|nr:ABC transporter ATP-binding protein [Dehalococcoidia bacterium]
MNRAAIRTENLTRDFGKIRAVDHLTLEVPTGSIFGFLGPNASGKTTTIHLLLGLLEPTSGRAEVLGFDTLKRGDDVRAHAGALLEHPGLYEQMSAEDNLEFYGRVWRMPASEREARAKELLTQLELWDRRKERIEKWSRGMKQKLALARALFHHPPLVFLDEPTAGLDVVAAAAVRESLAQLAAREGVTVFLTTHNMAEAEKLCRRVAVIRNGKLLAIGAPDELRRHAGSPRLEVVGNGFSDSVLAQLRARSEVSEVETRDRRLLLHLRQDVDTAPLVSMMVAAGVRVEEVHKGRASLEEVFLTLMEEER